MSQLISLILVSFCATSAFAGQVIFGEEAQAQYEVMLAQYTAQPATISKSEVTFLGSDSQPTWGKLRFTDLVALDGSNLRCWKEDYYEVGELVYGCSLP